MTDLLPMLAPVLVLTGVACILFLLGCSKAISARQVAPWLTLLALFSAVFFQIKYVPADVTIDRFTASIRLDLLSGYIIIVGCCVGIILLLLSWPADEEQTGNSGLRFGQDAGEYFALFLLSIAGLFLVAISNDLIIFFLSLELVSIPTYIMVSISRPAPVAQEAGVKYFFLGALSVALMLFGFSYFYGATGAVNFTQITQVFRRGLEVDQAPSLTSWQKLAVVLVLIGLAYKMAAFPLHFYAGDVYEGAGTPVTAFLAFVPKTAGFIALIRILSLVGGHNFAFPPWLRTLLWIIAALTMSLGNVLGLLQNNVKRVLAYSSIAHSGYVLVAVAALGSGDPHGNQLAIQGVLFYLAAYGIMNSGAFGVLMLLPSRLGSGSAETFDEIAGQGRRHVLLGLAMTIACFSLIGIPLTVGFVGKVLIILPAFHNGLRWLVIILIINAAISAAYYLRIAGTLFLRPKSALMTIDDQIISDPNAPWHQRGVAVGVIISAVLTMAFGTIPYATEMLSDYAGQSAHTAEVVPPSPPPAPTNK